MPAAGNNSDVVAAVQRQETLKDQRLDQKSAAARQVTSLAAERAEEHGWQNQLNAANAVLAAAQQRQEELKNQWLAGRGVTAATAVIAASERQENLKEQWLARHQLLHLVRSHGGIENGLHYRRDVTLHEDAGHWRLPNLGFVMALLNTIVLSLLGRDQSTPAQRLACDANPFQALKLLLKAPG